MMLSSAKRIIIGFVIVCPGLLPAGLLRAQSDIQAGGKQVFTSITVTDTARILRMATRAHELRKKGSDSAVTLFREVLLRSRQIDFNSGIAMGLMGLGICYTDRGAYRQGIDFIRQAFPYCEQASSGKADLMSLYYNNLAIPYSYQGQHEFAIACYYKALQILKDSTGGTSGKLPLVYNNIGAVWNSNQQYDKALHYLFEGERSALKTKRYDLLSSLYLNIAGSYGEKKDWPRHDAYIQRALAWSRHYRNAEMEQRVLTNAGASLVERNAPEKAIPYFREAITLTAQDPYYARLLPYKNLGIAWYMMKQYARSEQYLLSALEVTTRLGIRTRDLCDIHSTLAEVYTKRGAYRKALEHQKAYTLLNDSLLREERHKVLNRLELRYHTAEKDKEIAQNKLVISRQQHMIRTNRLWLGSLAGGTMLIGLFFYVLYRNRQRLQAEQIRTLQQGQEISQLKAQMKGEEKERARLARELHDGIVGQLSAVRMNFAAVQETYSALAAISGFRESLQQLEDTTRELRKTAHNLMPEVILQEGLSEGVRNFLFKINNTSGTRIDFHLSGALPPLYADFELSVYRMVQELVQNVLKHAGATKALVQLNCHDPLLMLTVEDNGQGLDPILLDNAGGMGMRNIRSRVKAFNGSIRLHSTPDTGTSICIEFDISGLKKDIPYAYKSSDY